METKEFKISVESDNIYGHTPGEEDVERWVCEGIRADRLDNSPVWNTWLKSLKVKTTEVK